MNETTDKVSAATINVASNEEVTPTEAVEEWRPVKGFETLYEVSNTGRIRTLDPKRHLYVLDQQVSRGEKIIKLWRRDIYKRQLLSVAIIVANAFLPKPENGEYVLVHINGDVQDNTVENLTWEQVYVDPSIEWRPVVGYEEHYEVSNRGDIRNKHNGRLLIPKVDRYGYLYLGLRYKKPRKWLTIHRAVAEAFIPNPENKATVDHINGNKFDNRPDNLRWATHGENFHNPVTFSFFKSKEYRDLKKRQQAHLNMAVVCLTDPPVFYCSLKEAERQTGIRHTSISGACRRLAAGKRLVASRNGKPVLHWRWATPEEIEAHKQQPE